MAILEHKIFLMALVVTIIAAVGIVKYPQELDKFIGMITTIWGTFVGAQLDMKKGRE